MVPQFEKIDTERYLKFKRSVRNGTKSIVSTVNQYARWRNETPWFGELYLLIQYIYCHEFF